MDLTRDSHGVLLAEALVALALAGGLVVAGLGLAGEAARIHRAAGWRAGAVEAAEVVAAHLAAVSYARLPEVFAAPAGASRAVLDSADGTAPPGWSALVQGLPGGEVRAELAGLARGGAAVPLGQALALQVRVRVRWRTAHALQAFEVVDVRA